MRTVDIFPKRRNHAGVIGRSAIISHEAESACYQTRTHPSRTVISRIAAFTFAPCAPREETILHAESGFTFRYFIGPFTDGYTVSVASDHKPAMRRTLVVDYVGHAMSLAKYRVHCKDYFQATLAASILRLAWRARPPIAAIFVRTSGLSDADRATAIAVRSASLTKDQRRRAPSVHAALRSSIVAYLFLRPI